jgi:uridine kinase
MKLIAIGGCSGAGKTTLARALTSHLADSTAIGLDSYYANRGPVANYDHPDALDWQLLDDHLDALAHGIPILVPIYDFSRHARTGGFHLVKPAAVVIVEGILALHDYDVRQHSDLKVYVDAPEGQCLDRRIERDIAQRGRTYASVIEQYESFTAPMAAEYVLPSRIFADLIVRGDRPVEEAVAAIIGHLSGD